MNKEMYQEFYNIGYTLSSILEQARLNKQQDLIAVLEPLVNQYALLTIKVAYMEEGE